MSAGNDTRVISAARSRCKCLTTREMGPTLSRVNATICSGLRKKVAMVRVLQFMPGKLLPYGLVSGASMNYLRKSPVP